MRTAFKPLIAAAFAGLSAAAALPALAGEAEVSYLKPAEFRDAGRDSFTRQRTMETLTQYVRLLARKLPDGQALKVEFTDIDLAGELYPSARHIEDLRVVRGGADWPRLWLRFSLNEGSRTLTSGEVQLADPGYTFSTLGRSLNSTELSYEKRLLKDWFDKTFAATAPR